MRKKKIAWMLLLLFLCFSGCDGTVSQSSEEPHVTLQDVPEFSQDAYVVINDNMPEFSEEDFSNQSYEWYSQLDDLGRCGTAMANIGLDLMPTEERGSISHIKPTGWHSVQYDQVEGKSLYNRCHLIGFQLTAENDNEKNLITGTRYMNVQGMLPFENMVADYIKETNQHVLYRVTPIFEGDNLVASGVEMEAMSVEDQGEGICFHVYVYNEQPGIVIDHADGESHLESEVKSSTEAMFILNTNAKKYHRPSCSSVQDMKEENRETFTGSKEELQMQGYQACKNCNP